MNRELMTEDQEASNIAREGEQDASFQRMIKFKREGEVYNYICDGEVIPLGTKMIAHAIGWTKTWVCFKDKQVVERKIYRVAKGDRVPERDDLPDKDTSKWSIGLNGKPADPWVLQYLLPLENPEDGEVRIFVASSFGGRRAVSELCSAYGRRRVKTPGTGQPLIKLEKTMMPTRNFGDVPRPIFSVVSWDINSVGEPQREISQATLKRQEMDDEIPF